MYTNLSLGSLPPQLWFRLFNTVCNQTPWEKHTYWRPYSSSPPGFPLPASDTFSTTSNKLLWSRSPMTCHCQSSISAQFSPALPTAPATADQSFSDHRVSNLSRWKPEHSSWVTFPHTPATSPRLMPEIVPVSPPLPDPHLSLASF